jgi:hypothetical protein
VGSKDVIWSQLSKKDVKAVGKLEIESIGRGGVENEGKLT